MFIDTHSHLDDGRFDPDLPEVLARAGQAGVERIITLGVDHSTSIAAVALCERHPALFAAVGIQPNHVAEARPGDSAEIERLASHPRVVAIGETGLDRYWDRSPFPLQEEFFVWHLRLAHRLGKPVVIHCREAATDVVRVLRGWCDAHGPIQGVMHSFTEDSATARACVEMGLHISFAGMITFKNAGALRAVAASIPIERLLIETDSPYLAPVPYRGQRNEPAYVVHTAACLAQVRQVAVELLAEQTTANARSLFRF